MVTGAEAEVAKLGEKLRLCQLELAQARREQEELTEASVSNAAVEQLVQDLCVRLDQRLVQGESVAGARGWLKRRVLSTMPTATEVGDLVLLRSSPLMDGGWYFRHYPATVSVGMSASLHYLRHGAREGKNPGPSFDTRAYVESHPEITADDNPLVHFLRSTPDQSR